MTVQIPAPFDLSAVTQATMRITNAGELWEKYRPKYTTRDHMSVFCMAVQNYQDWIYAETSRDQGTKVWAPLVSFSRNVGDYDVYLHYADGNKAYYCTVSKYLGYIVSPGRIHGSIHTPTNGVEFLSRYGCFALDDTGHRDQKGE